MNKHKSTKPAPKKARKKKRAARGLTQEERLQLVEAKSKAQKFDQMVETAADSPFRELLMKALKPSTARTRAGGWQGPFLASLAATCNVTVACKAAGIDRGTAYDHKKADKAFEALWEQALATGVELMEAELHRRAFEGTLKPVYQGGDLVGMIREFSDTLGIFLLKAHKPDKYRERISVKNETPNKPINQSALANKIAAVLGELQQDTPAGGPDPGGEG